MSSHQANSAVEIANLNVYGCNPICVIWLGLIQSLRLIHGSVLLNSIDTVSRESIVPHAVCTLTSNGP